MPFQSEKQRRWMWKNKPDMARKWTDEHGSTPVKAKKGKYQELEHPQHNITPIEHMEEKVSSKERIERLLNSRKAKKEFKKKLVKEGQGFVPGWRPNLSVKAAEGELVREKTRGTGAAIKGTNHYVMEGMDAAKEGKLIQVPTRGTGAAVKGTDHYVMEGMDAAKEGKMIKAKKGIGLPPATKYKKYLKSLKKITSSKKDILGKKDALSKINFATNKASMLKNLSDKIKYPTSKANFAKVAKDFTKTVGVFPHKLSKLNKAFLESRPPGSKLSKALIRAGKRTSIGKAVAAATVVAGAYEAGKRKLFSKNKPTKKSIGGETVVMKSGGGYIDDLL